MKKSNAIKRTVASSGQVYYFQGGKRVAAAKAASKWVKENFSSISPGQLEKLSERELKSFRGRQAATKGAEKIREATEKRLRFGGKFVSECLRLILQDLKLIDKTVKDLKTEYPSANTYGELLKQIKPAISQVTLAETEWGLPNEKRRRETYSNIIDIADRIFGNDNKKIKADEVFGTLALVVVDESGTVHEGEKGLEAIRKWETAKIDELMKAGGNPAYVSFQHVADIDPETCEMVIQLANSTEDPQYSP